MQHFIIAGAQRSGTTRLWTMLDRHPEVCMARPARPEPKFFLQDEDAATAYASYRARCFAHWAGEPALGEKTTSYLERHDAIARIARVLPSVRLVFVLRHPAYRAYSNWCFSRDNGLEALSFEDAIDAEAARRAQWDRRQFSVSPHGYAFKGFYARQLEPWRQAFGRECIHLVTYERLLSDPAAFEHLTDWLGLRPHAVADPGRVNASAPHVSAGQARALHALWAGYQEDIAVLREHWGLDLEHWKAPGQTASAHVAPRRAAR